MGRTVDIVTAFIVNRMLGATRGEARSEGGRRILTYNLGVRLLAVFFPALPLGGLYLAVRYGDDGMPLFVFGIIGAFMLLAAYLVYAVLLTRQEFDDNYIHFSTPLYRDRRIPWSSLTTGGYSASMTMYHLRAPEIGRIWVSPMQHGWVDMLRMAGGKLRERNGEDPFESLLPEA